MGVYKISIGPQEVEIGGGGNVGAGANIGDNAVVRGDGGGTDVQGSGVTIDDDGNMVLPGTGAITVPSGTTAQRPGTPTEGMARKNTTTEGFEFYIDGEWRQINRPYVVKGSDTTTVITAGNTFQLDIALDKKGYYVGTAALSGAQPDGIGYRGSVVSFDRNGDWTTVESAQPTVGSKYAAIFDSQRVVNVASNEWFATNEGIYLQSATLDADGDTVELIFKNGAGTSRTLLVYYRVVVW